MTLYDEIKNPLEDDNKIIEITNIYSNDNWHSLYTNFVTDFDYDVTTRNDYLRSFIIFILFPCSRIFYNYLKKQKPEEYDKNLLKIMKGIIVRPDIPESRKHDNVDYIKSRYIYPLSKYSQILKQFESFDDLIRYFDANIGPNLSDIERYGLDEVEDNKIEKN